MARSLQDHINELHQFKVVGEAWEKFEWLRYNSHPQELHVPTLHHLERVGRAMPIITFEAGCTPRTSAALYIASFLHDLGRLHLGNVGDSTKVLASENDDERFHSQRQHPLDGFILLPKLVQTTEPELDVLNDARAQILGHHTHFNSAHNSSNYPKQLVLDSTKELTRQSLSNLKRFGPLLGVVDTLEAIGIAPDSDRPYRSSRLLAEGYLQNAGEPSVTFATRIAVAELVQPHQEFGLSITDIGSLMLEHFDYIVDTTLRYSGQQDRTA